MKTTSRKGCEGYADELRAHGDFKLRYSPGFGPCIPTSARHLRERNEQGDFSLAGISLNEMPFRPHPRSSSVEEIMKHQLLSERRFFGEFLGLPEPPPAQVLPARQTPDDYASR